MESRRHVVGREHQRHACCIGGIRQGLHFGHVVRRLILQQLREHETFATGDDDVRAPVRVHADMGDLSDTSGAPSRKLCLRNTGDSADHAKATVPIPHVGQHLPVARFEEMERYRDARKEHHAEREQRDPDDHDRLKDADVQNVRRRVSGGTAPYRGGRGRE